MDFENPLSGDRTGDRAVGPPPHLRPATSTPAALELRSPGPAVASPASAPPPTPPSRVVWADIFEEVDQAAGLTIKRRDVVPPPFSRKQVVRTAAAGGSTPKGGGSATRARSSPRSRPSSSAHVPLEKGPALHGGRLRRRRPGGWGVTGRADRGPARFLWRPCPLSPRLPAGGESRSPPLLGCSPSLLAGGRQSPFRPFIAALTPSLQLPGPEELPRRPLPSRLRLPTAAAPAVQDGETLAPVPASRGLGRAALGPADAGLAIGPSSWVFDALSGLTLPARPDLALQSAPDDLDRSLTHLRIGRIWLPKGLPIPLIAAAAPCSSLVPLDATAPSPPSNPPQHPPVGRDPSMSREWGDAGSRPKRHLDDRQDQRRPSPDGQRWEEDLRRQLQGTRPEASYLSSHEPRRSPGRSDRHSPTHHDRRDRPWSPADRRLSQRRSPFLERRRDGSLSPGRRARSPPPSQRPQQQPASSQRRYQPPRNQPHFPPPNGGNGNKGRPGAKKKKRGPARAARTLQAPPPPAAAVASAEPAVDSDLEGPPCFNCGIPGHFQVACPNRPMCYLCKDPGHPVLLCLDRPVSEELMMYGHSIEGLGFFHIEVLDVPPPISSFRAIVMVLGEGVASSETIEAELNHLCWCQWDWQVTPTSGHEFTVIFPDATSHGYCTRSAEITLALNKLVVDISKPMLDPKAAAVLDTAWFLIKGLPDIARSERVIRNMSRILGKVVVVDELSLRKGEEVRVKVKSLDSSKLRATVRVFFNDLGYDLKISPEPPNHVGRPRYSDDGNNGGGPGGDDDYRGRHRHCSDREDDDELSDRSRSPSHGTPEHAPGRGSAVTGWSRSAQVPSGAVLSDPPPPEQPSSVLVSRGSPAKAGPPPPPRSSRRGERLIQRRTSGCPGVIPSVPCFIPGHRRPLRLRRTCVNVLPGAASYRPGGHLPIAPRPVVLPSCSHLPGADWVGAPPRRHPPGPSARCLGRAGATKDVRPGQPPRRCSAHGVYCGSDPGALRPRPSHCGGSCRDGGHPGGVPSQATPDGCLLRTGTVCVDTSDGLSSQCAARRCQTC